MNKANNQMHITNASLAATLERIVSATDEHAIRVALMDGAAKLQDAVLANQPSHELSDLVRNIPAHLTKAYNAVMDRAVSFAAQDDGSHLVTFLLPVALTLEHPANAILPLLTMGATSQDQLRLTASLQTQLGLEQGGGWVSVIPALYSTKQLLSADLGELIRLPQACRDMIRGKRKQAITITGNDAESSVAAGSHMYYLPFVARLPETVELTQPAQSEQVAYRMTKWVKASLAALGFSDDSVTVNVMAAPQPFAHALAAGARMLLDLRITEMTLSVCEKVNVQPNGLVALAAAYVAPSLSDEYAYVLGVTMLSRLTGQYVGTITLPMTSDAGTAEQAVQRVYHLLMGIGVQITQVIGAPVETHACQHCGHLQYQMPAMPTGANHDSTCIQ